jgi:pimeloyl-ACP methyl ester carboxylesterase
MRQLPRWFRVLMRTASVVPPLATAIAWRLFWHLGTPSAVRSHERAFHDGARVTALGDSVVYEWGSGAQRVLLVHGWRSRASRFAALGAELVERGFRVVAIDARGHGASAGERTHALEYAAAIRELGRSYGEFAAIIAHSFGALATFIAVRSGARTERIVTIAGVHDFDMVVDTFSTGIGLGRVATSGLRKRITRWALPLRVDVWRDVVAELDPTDTATSVLVVHDTDDAEVPYGQAVQIAEAHTGSVALELTTGLGHNRILSDPAVIQTVASFVQSPIGREQPTR